eukprot:8916269-Pyramimonas_sp.AAC.1
MAPSLPVPLPRGTPGTHGICADATHAREMPSKAIATCVVHEGVASPVKAPPEDANGFSTATADPGNI